MPLNLKFSTDYGLGEFVAEIEGPKGPGSINSRKQAGWSSPGVLRKEISGPAPKPPVGYQLKKEPRSYFAAEEKPDEKGGVKPSSQPTSSNKSNKQIENEPGE